VHRTECFSFLTSVWRFITGVAFYCRTDGERSRPGCSSTRLAANIEREMNRMAMEFFSSSNADRGAQSATPEAGVLPT